MREAGPKGVAGKGVRGGEASFSGALELRGGPFLHARRDTRALMREVLLSLLPVLAISVVFFGWVALGSAVACCLGAAVAERWAGSDGGWSRLRDGSSMITGLLLALSLPPALPLWMGVLGGVVAVGAGKMAFGGLGQNPFNPALVGRAFLQAAFPTVVTTWTKPDAPLEALAPAVLSWPFTHGAPVDAVTGATPLGLAKFEKVTTELGPLLWGNVGGSLGETSAVLLCGLGLVLGWRRTFDYRLPLGMLLSVAVLSAALHAGFPSVCPAPMFMLLSGGLLFAAVFLVTDPVTSPVTPRGAWIFGAGAGALVVLIRVFGGLPEGVMYAILIMNAGVPLIDRYTQPKPFGAQVSA